MDDFWHDSDERFVAEFEGRYWQGQQQYLRILIVEIAWFVVKFIVACAVMDGIERWTHARAYGLTPYVGAALAGSSWSKTQKARRRTNEVVESANDPRLVGFLARLTGSRSPSVRRSARVGLKAVLPFVRSWHANFVDSAAMHRLLDLLAKPTGAELTIRLIRSLEFIGDERAIEPLQRLADATTWSDSGLLLSKDIDAIAEAAAAAVPCIQQRADLTRQSSALLRPSAGQSDSLLRPVAETVQPEEQLLRESGTEHLP
jgi:hypothetical protein